MDTSAVDTPAALATSRMVGGLCRAGNSVIAVRPFAYVLTFRLPQ